MGQASLTAAENPSFTYTAGRDVAKLPRNLYCSPDFNQSAIEENSSYFYFVYSRVTGAVWLSLNVLFVLKISHLFKLSSLVN